MPSTAVGTVYLLKRAELAVRSCMEVALREFGLTPTQFLMLYRLRDRQAVSAAALAREVGLRPQSVIETLAPLERKGLLKREASARHRRILDTRLTAAGRRLLAEALRTAARIESQLLEDLGPAQLLALQEALTSLWTRAERHELHPRRAPAAPQSDAPARRAARPRRTAPGATRRAATRPRPR